MRCNICYLPIHDTSTKENCPRCFNDFHRDHLAAWLLKTNQCPVCREELSESFLELLRPKNEKERRRLEDIFRTLDGLGHILSSVEQRHKDTIMKSRQEEFGIEQTTIWDYLKVLTPLVFFVAFIFFILLALGN